MNLVVMMRQFSTVTREVDSCDFSRQRNHEGKLCHMVGWNLTGKSRFFRLSAQSQENSILFRNAMEFSVHYLVFNVRTRSATHN
jgi:hypothetical protein